MKITSMSAPWWAGALMAASATFALQGAARAQSCEADADCGAGYTCRTETYESCYGGWDCNMDGECGPIEQVCETYTSSWCANAGCETDADCPSFMACRPQTTWQCEGSMGGAGTGAGGFAGGPVDGGPTEPAPACEEVPAPSVCMPRHELPCDTASDCGGGFDCVETYYWMCEGGMGGAGGGAAGAGGAPAPADAGAPDEPGEIERDGGTPACEQVPSGSNACQLQDLPCDTTSDCPDGLECLEQYIYGACTGGGTGGSAGMYAGAGGSPAVDGGYDPVVCPEPEIEHRCMPRSHGGGGTGGTGGTGAGGSGGSEGEVDAGAGDPGAAGAAGMSAGVGGGGGADEDDGSDEDDGRGRGRGWLKRLLRGCSAGGPASSEGSIGWLMLGVAAVVLRRRAIKR